MVWSPLESPPEVLAITDDVPPAPVTSAGAAVDGASLSPSAVGEVAHELEPPPAGLVASAGVPLAPATISGANADASRQLPMMFETTVDATLVPATTGLGIASRTLPDHLIVYSRKPRRVETSSLAEEFLSKITKKVEALVPVPNIPKRRAKTAGPVSMPRRSRRIAKLPPETDTAAASIVCRKLGFANEEGRITVDALERYAKFYHDLLGRDHVAALSALFGWDVPPEGEARSAIGSIIVF